MNSLTKYSRQALGILRIVSALTYMEHGTQKLFHFPERAIQAASQGGGAGGPGGGGGGMPGYMQTVFLIGGIIEFFGGLAVLLGFLTRPIAFIVAGELAVVYWWMHVPRGGFWPVYNGGEAAILWCFTFLYLVVAGPGAFAVDNLLFRQKPAAA